jgi:hypothetical protein
MVLVSGRSSSLAMLVVAMLVVMLVVRCRIEPHLDQGGAVLFDQQSKVSYGYSKFSDP